MLLLGDVTTEAAVSGSGDAPTLAVRLLDSPVTLLITRIWIVLPFLISGLAKLMDWHAAESEMLRVGLHPAWTFTVAVLVTQLGGSALVIANRKLWLGAGALGVFTVLTNFIAHRFWEFSGDAHTAQLNSFLEHWTMSAAFVLVVVLNLRPAKTA